MHCAEDQVTRRNSDEEEPDVSDSLHYSFSMTTGHVYGALLAANMKMIIFELFNSLLISLARFKQIVIIVCLHCLHCLHLKM